MSALPFHAALDVDVVVWAGWSTAVSWWATRWADEQLDRDGWVTRLRPWERNGRTYAHLGIRRWKGRLPDLGFIFGGRPKQLPVGRDADKWRLLAGETRRAERAHWLILLALPVEGVIRSGIILVPMAAYAAIANLPCIMAQRYNRGRLGVLLAGRQRQVSGPRSV